MHIVDIIIFIIYLLGMLGIGWYFMRQNQNKEDYYVGGRNIGSWHIGLSVVATDVGGGFSIGLGGLGFVMGLAGSWLLFTGLLGAWLAAVFLIPKIKKLEETQTFYTFPQIFGYFYNSKVALLAGIISGIGYIGFTSSQILAGAKLASATVSSLDMTTALIVMGVVVVVYTVMGGIKAVIYSDTIQWIILMVGLIFIGIPIAIYKLGGWSKIYASLPPAFFDITNVSFVQVINWGVSIIPIWFVGMTLYQRIYASAGEKQAKKAWFIAGLFEYPAMAFMGVMLGLLSRVAADAGMFAYMGYDTIANLDKEMGLPLLLRTILPVGFLGIMLSAYFSAIMSTADSCLMAASGNMVTDILGHFFRFSDKKMLRISQLVTLLIGALALLLATFIQNVLSLMLYSYAFMVSGLFVPLLGALYWRKSHPIAAIWAMLLGGITTVILSIVTPGHFTLPLGLDANIFGISMSFVTFFILSHIFSKKTDYMSFKTEILNPENTHKNTTLDEITNFLFTHLGKYGDPATDIRKAIDYALSTDAGKGGLVLVVRDVHKNNEVIGTVVLNETGMKDYIPENILVYIAVHQDYRGAGIGKQLMEQTLQSVKGSVALHVEPDNPAKKLYEYLGFTNKYLEMRWKPTV